MSSIDNPFACKGITLMGQEIRQITSRRKRSQVSSVTSKGQATIPSDIRRKAGIVTGDKILFSFENGRIFIEKARPVDSLWNKGQSDMMSEWNHPDDDVYND